MDQARLYKQQTRVNSTCEAQRLEFLCLPAAETLKGWFWALLLFFAGLPWMGVNHGTKSLSHVLLTMKANVFGGLQWKKTHPLWLLFYRRG